MSRRAYKVHEGLGRERGFWPFWVREMVEWWLRQRRKSKLQFLVKEREAHFPSSLLFATYLFFF